MSKFFLSSKFIDGKWNFKRNSLNSTVIDCVVYFMNSVRDDIVCGIMSRLSIETDNFNNDHSDGQLCFL